MLVKNWDKLSELEKKSTRQGFGDAILSLGKNKNVVVVSADLAESLKIDKFAKKYPTRFIECGVAEQNAMGVAAGLALSGKIPFLASFAAFSPGRNWDQLRVSVCYSEANVKIASSHAGLAVGADGATHQALEDIAIVRCLPNITVLAPADYISMQQAVKAAVKIKGPVYLRFARQDGPVIYTANTRFMVGKANVLLKGTDVTIVACGPIIYEALLAAKQLARKKIKAEIIDCHTIKPLDNKTILSSIRKTKHLVTLEDHQVHGGLGSAIVEMLSQRYPVKTKIMGVEDKFGESGKAEELYNKYKLSHSHIVQSVLKLLK